MDSRVEAPAEYYEPDGWSAFEDEIGVDGKDFLEHHDFILSICEEYLKLLPKLFPENADDDATHQKRYALHHCDLRSANIIANPETFGITGIIDWRRQWHYQHGTASTIPYLSTTQSPLTTILSPIFLTRTIEIQSHPALVSSRDWWDARLLREVFDKKLVELGWMANWRPTSPQDKMKGDFIQGVSELGGYWRRARNIVEGIQQDVEAEEVSKL